MDLKILGILLAVVIVVAIVGVVLLNPPSGQSNTPSSSSNQPSTDTGNSATVNTGSADTTTTDKSTDSGSTNTGTTGSGSTNTDTTTEQPKEPAVKIEKPLGFFEFVDSLTFVPLTDLFGRDNVHIIVSSRGMDWDVRRHLDIKLSIIHNGKLVWSGMISGDPTIVCRGKDGCSGDGPSFKNEWAQGTLIITAIDSEEILLAYEKFVDGKSVSSGEEGVVVSELPDEGGSTLV